MDEQYVIDLYRQVLGREPDPQGLANNLALLQSGAISANDLANAFASSQEAQQNNIPAAQEQQAVQGLLNRSTEQSAPNPSSQIDQLYRNLLGRSPDAGAQGWINDINNGIDIQDVARQIANSAEGKSYAAFNPSKQFSSLVALSQGNNPYKDNPMYANLQYIGGGQFKDVGGGIINVDEAGQPISYNPSASWYDQQLAKNPSALRGTDYRNQVYLAGAPLDQTYNFQGKDIPIQATEYQVDQQTGKFITDQNGNYKPVEFRPKGYNMWDDWAAPVAVLALPALMAGGAYAAGAYGAGAGAGAGALETTGALGLSGGGAFVPAAGSGASFAIAPGAAYTAAGLGAGAAGQALPYTTAFDAANLYGQGLSQAAIEQNLAMTGIDPFLAADAASLASQGLSDAAIAQNLSYGYSPAELSGTGIESMALSSGGTGIDNLLSSLGSALKTPLGQLGVRGGLGLLSSAGQQAQVPQVAGGSGTYAPKGQVDYTPILNLLAPRQIARNTNSLLG
jgi:hypothetical protein